MKQYSKKALEELREAVDIERLLKALDYEIKYETVVFDCPFCENEGSFVIDTEVGNHKYYCFNCYAKGDAMTLLMSGYKKTFEQAIEFLATMFHIKMDVDSCKDTEEEKEEQKNKINGEIAQEIYSRMDRKDLELLFGLSLTDKNIQFAREFVKKLREATEKNQG